MVSKPTGRPRGRPRRHVTATPKKGSGGRPVRSLASDPERYWLAYAGAVFRDAADRGISELRTAESLCKLRLMTDKPDNLDRLFRGEKVEIYAPSHKGNVGKWTPGKTRWRDSNEFRPHAHDHKTKIYRLRIRNDRNGHWLQALSLAYLHCLRGNADKIETVRRFAAFCGETRHCEEVMIPMLLRRHQARRAA